MTTVHYSFMIMLHASSRILLAILHRVNFKALTSQKKSLEKELDDAVGLKDADAELAESKLSWDGLRESLGLKKKLES